jgi:hypothetical protein
VKYKIFCVLLFVWIQAIIFISVCHTPIQMWLQGFIFWRCRHGYKHSSLLAQVLGKVIQCKDYMLQYKRFTKSLSLGLVNWFCSAKVLHALTICFAYSFCSLLFNFLLSFILYWGYGCVTHSKTYNLPGASFFCLQHFCFSDPVIKC